MNLLSLLLLCFYCIFLFQEIFVVSTVHKCITSEYRRKEGFYLTTHSTHLVMVIWRRTYGKVPFR